MLEGLTWLPLLPNLADQRRSRLEGRLAGDPTRGRGLSSLSLSHVLKRLNLANEFVDVAAHRRRQHLHRLDDAIGINEEAPSYVYAGLLVIDAVLSL